MELTGQCKISGAATRVTRSRIVLSSVTAVPWLSGSRHLAPNRRSIMLSGPWHSVASSHQQTSARRSTAAEARQEPPGPWTRSGVFGGRVGELLPIGSDQLISVAGACTGLGHASDGSDFDTDLSRNV